MHNTDDHCSESKLQSTMHDREANSLKDVGSLFARLGVCMVEVGLLVARLCDYGIFRSLSNHTTKHTVRTGLEQAIQESGTAKGRLIHYHSIQEKALLTLSSKAIKNRNSKKVRNLNLYMYLNISKLFLLSILNPISFRCSWTIEYDELKLFLGSCRSHQM